MKSWTHEEDQWLRNNFHLAKTWSGLLAAYNYQFYPNVRTLYSLQCRCKQKLGLKALKDPRRFTTEEDQFLKDNIATANSLQDLTDRFNAYFHTQRHKGSISDRCSKQLNLHISKLNPDRKTGKFELGDSVRSLPLGTLRESSTGTYIKVQELPESTKISGYQKPYWMPYQEFIYREYTLDPDSIDDSLYQPHTLSNGRKLPVLQKDEFICFLDNDRHDFDIENLYPINRSISAMMSSNQWWSTNRSITLAGILACQLYFVMKDKKI